MSSNGKQRQEAASQANPDSRPAGEQQLDLLRRALVRVSMAAAGRHPHLDRDLAALRGSLHDQTSLGEAVERLEATLLEIEVGDRELADSLRQLARGLLDVAPERGSRNRLKSFLQTPAERDLGAALKELAELQQQVLGQGSRPGLLGRILGRPDASGGEIPLADDSPAEQVRSLLVDMLEKIEPLESNREQIEATRKQLQQSLDWGGLMPLFEDVRDLVLQCYLDVDQQHRQYLLHMHQQLQDMAASLGVLGRSYQREHKDDLRLEQQLSDQLDSMGQSVAAATDLATLQAHIDQHLHLIRDAVHKRQQAREANRPEDHLDRLALRLQQVEEEARTVKQELETQKSRALTDALTGLPNREAYDQRARDEWLRRQRFHQPLTLAVCDIDSFKHINDRFGHQTGDRVLQVLGKTMAQRLRSVDFIARYGGEEFVILLPGTPVADGWGLLDKIRAAIASAPFRFRHQPLQVTLSAGLVQARDGESAEEAFQRADALLYRAKEEGRNRCLYEE